MKRLILILHQLTGLIFSIVIFIIMVFKSV
nr:MAG TPA: hypothetical protein [Caudoviricetes sp.]